MEVQFSVNALVRTLGKRNLDCDTYDENGYCQCTHCSNTSTATFNTIPTAINPNIDRNATARNLSYAFNDSPTAETLIDLGHNHNNNHSNNNTLQNNRRHIVNSSLLTATQPKCHAHLHQSKVHPRYLLVVEKEGIYHRLCEDEFYR